MDDIENAILLLATESEKLAEQTHGEPSKDLLRDAAEVLRRAASAHHDAT